MGKTLETKHFIGEVEVMDIQCRLGGMDLFFREESGYDSEEVEIYFIDSVGEVEGRIEIRATVEDGSLFLEFDVTH